jgi:hypothetical protein
MSMKRTFRHLVAQAASCALILSASSVEASEIANNEFSKFKVKLGGFFYGAVHYDTNAQASRPWLNVVSGKAPRGALSLDPYGTRTNLSIESTLSEERKAIGFLEVDWAPVTGPRLRHAYVALESPALSVLVGQYWVPYGTPGPDTYNPQWFFRQGNPYSRAPQLTVFRKLGQITSSVTLTTTTFLGGSVVKGNAATGSYALAEGIVPAGFLRLAYELEGKKGFVALTGGTGRIEATYSVASEGRPRPKANSAFAELSTSLQFAPVSLSGKLFWGRGAGMGTAVGQTLVVDAESQGHSIQALGGYVSGKLALSSGWALALFAGLDDPTDEVSGVTVPIQRNLTLGGQANWSPLEGANLALELMQVSTRMASAEGAQHFNDLRSSLIARYAF